MKPEQAQEYEVPRVMRLDETRQGRGVCDPGSGDTEACYEPGNSAALECNEPGNSAVGATCNYPGNSATLMCTQPGNAIP